MVKKGQLELPVERQPEPDRNLHKGGRSFYFFDFDDNVAFLSSQIYIFHKETGEELALPTGEYARHSKQIGKNGIYRDWEVRLCDQTGSFRRFRDWDEVALMQTLSKSQPFIQDLAEALGHPDFKWKGPSWNCFLHATFNQRPLSLITARGHSSETIKEGLKLLVETHHISKEPNYLAVYPVSHPGTREELGDRECRMSVAELKQRAIRASVLKAIEVYGYNDHHRFGMSDDDPHNIELIMEEMLILKRDFPKMSFFVIETHGDRYTKKEIFADHCEVEHLQSPLFQLSLFDKQ